MTASDCLRYGNRYNLLSKLLAGDILGQRAIPAIVGAARTGGVRTPGQETRCHGHNKSILTPDPKSPDPKSRPSNISVRPFNLASHDILLRRNRRGLTV